MYKLITITLLLAFSGTNHADCKSTITHTAPNSRYELLNSNTEVKDTQTGLIWQRCSLGQTWSGTSCTGWAASYNWTNALQTAKNMGSGWRIPNVKELDSLIEQACYAPSINNVIFPITQVNFYWSSSTPPYNSSIAWIVRFGDGAANVDLKPNNHHVRLVRSSE